MTPPATAILQWHDDWLLGFAPMDEVHEEFVELVRTLQLAPDDQLPRALDAFAIHARQHFDLEDAWMNQTDFPARGCHVDEHAAVLATVHGVQRRVAAGEFAVGRRLADELLDWFPGHAQHLDSALAHWMCKLRLGGKPVVMRRRVDTIRPPA